MRKTVDYIKTILENNNLLNLHEKIHLIVNSIKNS